MKNSIAAVLVIIGLFGVLCRCFAMNAFEAIGGSGGLGGDRGAQIVSLWESGNKDDARNLVNRWIKEDKTSAVPYVFAAVLKFEENEFKSCLSLSQKAIERDPHLAEAYFWRGRAFEALKKYLDASNEYKAALAIRKDFSAAQMRLNQVEALMSGAADSK